jgi:hypothetical protein
MNKWLKYPEEDGHYFLRWNWWAKENTECVNVYTDESNECWSYVSRLCMSDMNVDDLPKGCLWMKIDLPDIEE